MTLNDLTGKRYGALVVIERSGTQLVGSAQDKQPTWLCRCDCGKSAIVRGYHLSRGSKKFCTECGRRRRRLKGSHSPKWTGHGQLSGSYWSSVCCNAKARSLPVSISIEFAWRLFELQRGRCALSGAEIAFSTGGKGPGRRHTASLDRIDSSRGYEPDNVQWVHKRIQLMKLTLGQDEFVAWCALVAECSAKVRAA